jgi:hypothetical protein
MLDKARICGAKGFDPDSGLEIETGEHVKHPCASPSGLSSSVNYEHAQTLSTSP